MMQWGLVLSDLDRISSFESEQSTSLKTFIYPLIDFGKS